MKAEIDIIALNKNILVIVEVQVRSGSVFGNPEDPVSPKKNKTSSYGFGSFHTNRRT